MRLIKKACPECGGEGQLVFYQMSSSGGPGHYSKCTVCEGTGRIYVERKEHEEDKDNEI